MERYSSLTSSYVFFSCAGGFAVTVLGLGALARETPRVYNSSLCSGVSEACGLRGMPRAACKRACGPFRLYTQTRVKAGCLDGSVRERAAPEADDPFLGLLKFG